MQQSARGQIPAVDLRMLGRSARAGGQRVARQRTLKAIGEVAWHFLVEAHRLLPDRRLELGGALNHRFLLCRQPQTGSKSTETRSHLGVPANASGNLGVALEPFLRHCQTGTSIMTMKQDLADRERDIHWPEGFDPSQADLSRGSYSQRFGIHMFVTEH
jgi:hypothetical protein